MYGIKLLPLLKTYGFSISIKAKDTISIIKTKPQRSKVLVFQYDFLEIPLDIANLKFVLLNKVFIINEIPREIVMKSGEIPVKTSPNEKLPVKIRKTIGKIQNNNKK